MKIGILTFHFAINYGAVIQAWALQTYLRSMGHDVVIINYDPRRRRFPWFVHALKRGFRSFVLEVKFRLFRVRYLKETKRIWKKDSIAGLGFDVYIVGSDQVWNIDFFNFNRHYFLDFVPVGKLKIAYAASVGEGIWNSNRLELERLLSSFDAISVRENYAKSVVDRFSARRTTVVPDPTFLVSSDEYRKLMGRGLDKKNGKFRIFIYGLNGVDRCMMILAEVLKYCHCPEIRVMKLSGLSIERLDGMKLVWPSPIGWLREIMDADLVITDSFHGVSLSFVLNRKVLTFYKQEEPRTSDRIATLLNSLKCASMAVDLYDLSASVQSHFLYKESVTQESVHEFSSVGKIWLKEQLKEKCQ